MDFYQYIILTYVIVTVLSLAMALLGWALRSVFSIDPDRVWEDMKWFLKHRVFKVRNRRISKPYHLFRDWLRGY